MPQSFPTKYIYHPVENEFQSFPTGCNKCMPSRSLSPLNSPGLVNRRPTFIKVEIVLFTAISPGPDDLPKSRGSL